STGSGCGSATSNAVQITFQPDPSITDNPDNGTICPGGSHQMFADATGGVGSYHYVWQYYNGSTWIDAQDSSINHYTASPGSSTNYRVIVMSDGSGCDVATSGTATVTVVAEPIAPTATKSPNVATVCSGTTLTLTGVTDNGGGTGSCNFEYCYSTNGGSSYSAWSTSLPSFAATGTNNRIKLRKNCNGSGCDISPETTYTWAVDAASVGGTASANPSTAICAGETADLSVSGYTGSIQWQTNASGSWANIPGATSNTYTTPQLPVTTSYQAVVTNGVCSSSANSNIITVTVITPITTGLSGNDYIWTGATSQTWNGATTTNWLKFISASVFEIPAQVPDITDNVFIRSNGSCFGTIPVVTTTNVAECNNLTIDPGCGLNISATGNLKIYGNLTNNGTLSVFSTAPIEIKGNWNNSGDFNAGSGNVLFSGSNIQSIKSNNDSFYGIEFNNSHAGNYDLTLTDNLTVTYNAKFVNGIVNTGSNKFIFTAPATTTVGTTTSFVDGLVEKLGCVKFTFPTGNVNPARDISAGPQYYRIWAPLTATVFSPPATVNVKYLFTNENLNPWWYHVWTHEAPLTHTSDREYWLVNSPSNLEVELFWNNNNPCSIHDFCAPGPTDFLQDELTVAYWNGIWKDAGGSPTGTYNTGDITSTIYIPFGAKGERQITFGAKDTELPLPVDLIKFYAECDNNSAIISWETASETNNDYFILEKSNDMISFFELARIEGAGNSNTLLSYSNVDNELFSGNNYYRLKQVDYDGRTRTYNTISINCDKSSSELPSLIAYPNPFTNELNVVIDNIQESDFVLELYDNIGKLIFSQEYTTEETSFHTVLDLTNLLPAVYNLRSRSEGCVMNVKVVKK
ncbi:MAG TPA: T9SS type A sorting domain-containing protein, partial [Bacteroidales bacterium]|nr:T9SS type A sorting domain-containing protein [Bacteroidales bacterium]